MRKIFYSILLSLIIHGLGYAQIAVPVDMQTGAPAISIPIHTITNGDVSVPISLYYVPGVKVSQPFGNDEYNIGVGWGVTAGGKIIRSVKSLPDDYQGTGSDTRTGWLYGSGAGSIANFTPQSRTDCNSDAVNYAILNTLANTSTDTEPDVFSFNFGGYSGQFMFDNNKIIQLMPYQDLNIQPTYSANGAIGSFIITANNGVRYTFMPTTTITLTITPADAINNVLYLRDRLIKYAQPVTYTATWGLASVDSPSGGSITLSYGGSGLETIDTVYTSPPSTDIYLAGSNNSSNGIYKKSLFYNKTITDTKRLSAIYESTANNYPQTSPARESINLTYQNSLLTGFKVYVDNVLSKTISLNEINTGGYIFLQSVHSYSNACTVSPPYEFEYLGTTLGVSTILASPQSKEQDYWGYYNANKATTLVPNLYMYPNEPLQERYRLQQIPGYAGTYNYLSDGADRTVNPSAITAGSLYRIIYPTGGSVKIDYEPNQYFDAKANQTFFGGGIRVKTVTLHDGINTTNDIVKNYSYSGGVLLNRPQFAFPIPVYTDYGGTAHTIEEYTDQPTQARFFTARSENDLNPYSFDSPDVHYQSATESQVGKGNIVYHYSEPATFAQITSSEYSAPNQWQATYSQYATTFNPSSGACMSKGLIGDGYYAFPYPTNPNYSFERDLLQNTQAFNEAGQLVKRIDYQYSPIFQNTSPVSIYGLTYDYFTYNSNDINTKAFVYGKYRLFAAMNKYLTSTVETTYDPGTNFTKSATVETDNFFNSPNHKMLSAATTTVSNDGVNFTSYKIKYTYPQDYTASSGTDPVAAAILALKNSHMNSTVIEKVSSITKPGQSELVTGAQLNKFNVFSVSNPQFPSPPASFTTKILPTQTLILRTNTPLSNFTASAINNSQFQYDSRYQVSNNITEYSTMGSPVSVDDGHQNTAATLYDITGVKPIAYIKNALASQVLYSNFDDEFPVFTTLHSFDEALNSGFTPVAGRIGNALSVAPNYSFTKSVVSKGSGNNYVFSCWIKNPTNLAGTMTVTLSDGSHTSSGVINYTSTTGVWTYYRIRIPVTTLNSTFSINVQTGSLPLMVDDMLFHPELAQVALIGYQNKLKIADTDPHGNTTFYSYDGLGRPTITTDQNQNILKRIVYSYRSSYAINAAFIYDVKPIGGGAEFISPNLPATVTANTPVDFLNGFPDPCEPASIVRNWDFGDGTTLANGGTSPSHTYTTAGIYTITLTVTDPQYGTSTTTQTITIVNQLAFTLHLNGIAAYNLCAQQVLLTGDLPLTNPVGTDTFIASVDGSYTNQFKWEQAYSTAPNTWITLPSTTNTVTITVPRNQDGTISSTKSYKIRCTMIPQYLEKADVSTTSIAFLALGCNQ